MVPLTREIMKKLILFVSLLSAAAAYPQTFSDQDNITYKDGLYMQNDLAYTGRYVIYYNNGAVKEELNIKEGRLNGEDTKYFENGKKMEVGHYENNLKYGLWARYNPAGTLTAEASYSKNGRKDGTWMVYNDAGAKLFKMEYKDGEKTGTWMQWDESGNLVKSTPYSNL